MFLKSGGIGDATEILTDFHRNAQSEMNKAAEVESEVIDQLSGLRNDLQKKTKEIKALSGDFKNSVDKEVDVTRKSVRHLHEALGLVDTDPSAISGKGDPFIVRLGVEKQIERQIEEENYLHRVRDCLVSMGCANILGVFEPGKFWPRVGVYCGWRDPKGLQRLCRYSETGRKSHARHGRQITSRSSRNG